MASYGSDAETKLVIMTVNFIFERIKNYLIIPRQGRINNVADVSIETGLPTNCQF